MGEMDSESGRSNQISKLDAARRQLETAIKLYFADLDSVSIHTLTCASHEILFQIGREKKISSIIRHKFKELIKEEKFGYVMVEFDKIANFFKHGSDGARKQLTFNPKFTELWLWDSCLMYQQFAGEFTDYMGCFHLWYMVHNRELLNQLAASKLGQLELLLKYSKQEFLKMFLEAQQQRL